MSDLRPCPWCNVSPKMKTGQFMSAPSIRYSVQCYGSKCPVHPVLFWRDTREDAIAAWNARASDAQAEKLAVLLHEMRDAVKDVPAMNNCRYDALGVAVNAALAAYDAGRK